MSEMDGNHLGYRLRLAKMNTYNGNRGSPLGTFSYLGGRGGCMLLSAGDFVRLTSMPRPAEAPYAFSSNVVVSTGELIPVGRTPFELFSRFHMVPT